MFFFFIFVRLAKYNAQTGLSSRFDAKKVITPYNMVFRPPGQYKVNNTFLSRSQNSHKSFKTVVFYAQ